MVIEFWSAVWMSNAVGLVAPRATPEAAIARLAEAADHATSDAGVRDVFARNGAEVAGAKAEAYARYVQEERARFAEIIGATGITLE